MSTEIQRESAMPRGVAYEDDSSAALGLGHHATKVQIQGHVDADMHYDVEGTGDSSGGIERFFEEQVQVARDKLHAEQRRQSILNRRQKYLNRHPDVLQRNPQLDKYLDVKDAARAVELAEELATRDYERGIDLIPFEKLETVNRDAYRWIERRAAELHDGGQGLSLFDAYAVARDEDERGVSAPIDDRPRDDDDAYLYGDEEGQRTISSLMQRSRIGGVGGNKHGKRRQKYRTAPVCQICGLQGCTPGCECEKAACPACKHARPKNGKKKIGRPRKDGPDRARDAAQQLVRMNADTVQTVRDLDISPADALALFAIAYREGRPLDDVIQQWKREHDHATNAGNNIEAA